MAAREAVAVMVAEEEAVGEEVELACLGVGRLWLDSGSGNKEDRGLISAKGPTGCSRRAGKRHL